MAIGRYGALPPTHILEHRIVDMEARLELIHTYIKNACNEAKVLRYQINWIKRKIKEEEKNVGKG